MTLNKLANYSIEEHKNWYNYPSQSRFLILPIFFCISVINLRYLFTKNKTCYFSLSEIQHDHRHSRCCFMSTYNRIKGSIWLCMRSKVIRIIMPSRLSRVFWVLRWSHVQYGGLLPRMQGYPELPDRRRPRQVFPKIHQRILDEAIWKMMNV